ncbi:carbon monoxide dehydrogenase [Variovorax sp. WS11]|uniref:FAD binding domain-containing protein n=1 Tax=Variovorax sp. WS11 TaxID=1105204 RepID=UPI000D0DC48B|nr:FAD binding domain-containing protein [Variovorax sp. WS11]NDZ17910.1 carbon monoxide dehydrogenase [Variovorax sp. WS11]PSL85003.1 carbon monoxide dehydrogenase [Variovorax sp. WS11]
MKAANFDYQRPLTLQAALRFLADAGGSAKVMGGGQSLGPMLNLRLTRPKLVIDVSALEELRQVRQQGAAIRIGAAVTHAEIEDGVHALLRGGLLQSVAGGIAYRAIRNRGTVGGSLAHADPAADWVLAATALGAEVEIATQAGTRRVPMDGFMQGAYTTVLGEGELLAALWVRRLGPAARWGYFKFCRKTGEFAEASCAAVFDPARKLARVVLGALDGAPRALPALAAQVARSGAVPDRPSIEAAVTAAAASKDAVDRKLLAAAVERCLGQVLTPEPVQ